MSKKVFIVIDMQNDFVYDALGSNDAKSIVSNVVKSVLDAKDENCEIIFTRDTHDSDYLSSREGKFLPITHCIKDTRGWQIIDELLPFVNDATVFDKPTFGSVELCEYLKKLSPDCVTLVGVCTDICVVSNALLIKANLPQTDIFVIEKCCAGVTKKSHRHAIETMKSCQITIL